MASHPRPDTTGFAARERAENYDRAAAAHAHASYYAHPELHEHDEHGNLVDPDTIADDGVGPLNHPAPGSQASKKPLHSALQKKSTQQRPQELTTNEIAEIKGTNEGKKEEAGGMEETAPPSGLDKGAREFGGEAGGTHTSPGPAAGIVQAAKQAQAGQLPGVAVTGVLNMPGDNVPDAGAHWSSDTIMEPHLQLMCGPLLNYYTIENNVWYGAAMIVTADEGSILSPEPFLTLTFHQFGSNDNREVAQGQKVAGQRIHTYEDENGKNSFWRFMIQVPVQAFETSVRYRLNTGAEIRFVVPAAGQNFNWVAHSCNGFSSGVNPDEFKGDYPSGYDPVWEDVINKHHERPFHCMVGGGDQIYCDALTREEELQGWINAPNREKKLGYELTPLMKHCVDRFYFNHYCKIFRSNAFGRANSTIPMVNMLDDHDIIDGFGTYDDETQAAPVFSFIGGRGYFWFLLFQLFTVDSVDGTSRQLGSHPIKSMVIGGPGAWIEYPNHSLNVYMGPKVRLYALDCRAERKLHQICSQTTYSTCFDIIASYPAEVEHFVFLLGVPIAYPRMSFLEHFLDFKWNPINMLARRNALGLGSMVNKFNQASELLDDLNDHWCANVHKKERNWLVLEMQRVAMQFGLRVTFLSGDVHLAAVGCLFTHKAKKLHLDPKNDHRYMLNVVSSAIVNTPPPAGAARMVSTLSGNKHRTLHGQKTDERMLPLFDIDTDGKTKLKRPYALARRNYTKVAYKPETGDLLFEFRIEKSQGSGNTVPYPINAPPPHYGGADVPAAPAGAALVNGQPIQPGATNGVGAPPGAGLNSQVAVPKSVNQGTGVPVAAGVLPGGVPGAGGAHGASGVEDRQNNQAGQAQYQDAHGGPVGNGQQAFNDQQAAFNSQQASQGNQNAQPDGYQAQAQGYQQQAQAQGYQQQAQAQGYQQQAQAPQGYQQQAQAPQGYQQQAQPGYDQAQAGYQQQAQPQAAQGYTQPPAGYPAGAQQVVNGAQQVVNSAQQQYR